MLIFLTKFAYFFGYPLWTLWSKKVGFGQKLFDQDEKITGFDDEKWRFGQKKWAFGHF